MADGPNIFQMLLVTYCKLTKFNKTRKLDISACISERPEVRSMNPGPQAVPNIAGSALTFSGYFKQNQLSPEV